MECDETKVMVAVPTNKVKHYCLGKFIDSLNRIQDVHTFCVVDDTRDDDTPMNINRGNDVEGGAKYTEILKKSGLQVLRVEDTVNAKEKPIIRQRLINARKKLRTEFLKSDCTHMLFIDSDVIVPENIIPLLLSAKTDIISGVYWQRDRDLVARTLIYKFMDKESWKLNLVDFGNPLTVTDLIPSRILGRDDDDIHIVAIGFGSVLISRKVLEDDRWDFRWGTDNPKVLATEDMFWSLDMHSLGYDIYCHTGVLCKHYPKQWEGAI